MSSPRKIPVRHKVSSHVRDKHHVKSYIRGKGEKPKTSFFMNKSSAHKPVVDPLREKVEALVDKKILEQKEQIMKHDGGYWDKISKFQLDYDGKHWRLIRAYDNGGGQASEDCELCGHKHCRYMFVIGSADKQLTIGSECVGNYTNDAHAKDILKRFQNNVVKKSAKVGKYRDLIIRTTIWIHKNKPMDILNSILTQMLDGKDISARQIGAVEKIISKDLPKNDDFLVLLEKARKQVSNDWERDFVASVTDQYKRGRTMSEKQLALINKIASR